VIARGSALGVRGCLLEARLPGARIGDGVSISTQPHATIGQVLGIAGERAFVAVHTGLEGIAAGTALAQDMTVQSMPLGTCAFGRAIDARGAPLDGGPPLCGPRAGLDVRAPAPHERAPVVAPLWTGLRAVDGLLTFGRGARIGIFGSPGAGKSTLLEAIARGCAADAVVVGLCGERGREAQRWIDARDHRMTIVCATSDRPAAQRVRAAHVAIAQARALRARGLHVVLVLDSLARVAAALRELGVALGESVGRGGYPPSVFSELARMVEVAGAARRGSITLIATVLDDGDERDPVSDAARSLLDGHIQLTARLAHAGRFPAIDVPASASRTMPHVASTGHLADAAAVRRALSLLARIDDARLLGIAPTDDAAARAIGAEQSLERFLYQADERTSPDRTLRLLAELADTLEGRHGY
jgi:ATP synthase in type III secretion protein N